MANLFRVPFAVLLALAAPAAHAAAPPGQPEKGAGGAEYRLPASEIVKISYGKDAGQVFVFRPQGDQPRPAVVFLHSWGAVSPRVYGAWIEHLVRRGHAVIYPRFQDGRTQRKDATANALAGLKLALEREGGRIDRGKVAYVGHAAGGILAANLAARAAGEGLPAPRLLYVAAPGSSWATKYLRTDLDDLGTMPAEVMIVAVIGEGDTVVRDTDARKILRTTEAVPTARKMLIKIPSDNHGTPSLSSGHFAPTARNDEYDIAAIPDGDPKPPAPPPQVGRRGQAAGARAPAAAPPEPVRVDGTGLPRGPDGRVQLPPPDEFGGAAVDAIDWFGFWKTLDMALAAAFEGGDTGRIKRDPRLLEMGAWSDNWPVKRLTFESAREAQPASSQATPPAAATPTARAPAR